MSKNVLIPLIVACALFLQQLDATALATALPTMAKALDETPIRLHLLITAYMFSVAAFLPAGGWLADRFGGLTVFRLAIALFTLASATCGLATSFEMLLVSRLVQGIGGAMMVPVGRLILVRSVPKAELVKAMALMSMPALMGPISGPLVGGFLTTFASWRWVFWVNLPIGLIGILLATHYIENEPEPERRPFDVMGFVLSGVGLSGLLFGVDTAASGTEPASIAWPCVAVGVLALALYLRHARHAASPILDLRLIRIPTFRASVLGGSLFRLGAGAMPFLLPLLLQEQFGYTPLQSGLTTFVAAIGSLGMRSVSSVVLRHTGFRPVLCWNALIAAGLMFACGLFRPSTPYVVIIATLFLGGVFRSLELIGVNALLFADMKRAQMSHATSLSTMAQRLSQSMAVAVAAFALHIAAGGPDLTLGSFQAAFVTIALFSASSMLVFLRLDANAGAELAGRGGVRARD